MIRSMRESFIRNARDVQSPRSGMNFKPQPLVFIESWIQNSYYDLQAHIKD